MQIRHDEGEVNQTGAESSGAALDQLTGGKSPASVVAISLEKTSFYSDLQRGQTFLTMGAEPKPHWLFRMECYRQRGKSTGRVKPTISLNMIERQQSSRWRWCF